MAYSLENTTDLTNLADAIRAKTGNSGGLSVADMAQEVASISTGGSLPDEYIEFTLRYGQPYIATIHTQLTQPIFSCYKSTIEQAILPNQITHLPEGAFGWCWKLRNVNIPTGLISINSDAFNSCNNLVITNLPDTITTIGTTAFNNCGNVVLTHLPNSLTSIGMSAFSGCSGLADITIPSNTTFLSTFCFRNCSNLTSVKFEGTPNTIMSNSFNGCSHLTDIYVPWSEGAVSGAPWGATNATIHYDWTPSN